MKVVCHELLMAMNDPEGSGMDEILKDADRLVLCLANKVSDALISILLDCIFHFVTNTCILPLVGVFCRLARLLSSA